MPLISIVCCGNKSNGKPCTQPVRVIEGTSEAYSSNCRVRIRGGRTEAFCWRHANQVNIVGDEIMNPPLSEEMQLMVKDLVGIFNNKLRL